MAGAALADKKRVLLFVVNGFMVAGGNDVAPSAQGVEQDEEA